ncbi:MAG TPA: DUF4307 domain-containing protein [Micromonosporaceae bacterium]|nr:DUF4307 domain-containing protein [Micromonosporaceae bacterium]
MIDSTQATTPGAGPVFPPGRYGRRREPGRRRRWLPVFTAIAVALGALALTLRLYAQYGNPPYEASVIRVTETADDHVTIEFAVTVPAGGAASCTVRALASSGLQVGRDTVEVRAAAGQTRVVSTYRLATTGPARVADVPGCGPADRR